MLRMFFREYFRPDDLVEVGTLTWLGLTIAALAVMYVFSFPSLWWIFGLIMAINVGVVTVVTAYYEYTAAGRQRWTA
jgi:uncharacterized protein YqfA (UPF0365 family)